MYPIIIVVCIVVIVIEACVILLMRARIRKQDAGHIEKPKDHLITRQEIVAYARKLNSKIVIKEAQEPQFPYSIRWKNKTVVMLYGTDKGVMMIVRLNEKDKEEISKIHELKQAKFPRGKYWSSVLIDNTFIVKEQVFRILHMATGIPQPQEVVTEPELVVCAQPDVDALKPETGDTKCPRSAKVWRV